MNNLFNNVQFQDAVSLYHKVSKMASKLGHSVCHLGDTVCRYSVIV